MVLVCLCLLGDRVNKPINLLLHTSLDHSLRTLLVVARAFANLNSYRSLPSSLLTDTAEGTSRQGRGQVE